MSIIDKKRIVIKVGSSLIAPKDNGCSSHNLLAIAQFIIKCKERGQQVVLVSSGSVAAGRKWFNQNEKMTVTLKKAMSAAGQTDMMEVWDKLVDFPTAQMLLTNADLCNRDRYLSIRDTIEACLEQAVLPIVNENDTVTADHLKVGDNDNLSAMVASSISADALIMCTDVDGLFDANPVTNPDAKLITEVSQIDEAVYAMAGGAISATGTGGMQTKIEAAEKATSHGIDTFIINGFNSKVFETLLEGGNPGTHFEAFDAPIPSGLHWMTNVVKESGEVIVDEQDFDSEEMQESITGSSILEVIGEFAVGDTIVLRNNSGKRIVKAKSNYSSCFLSYLADKDIRGKLDKNSHLLTNSIISDEHMAVLGDS